MWENNCNRNCCCYDGYRITSSWMFSLFLSISFYLPTYLSLSLILSRYYPLSVARLNHLPLTLHFAVWLLPHLCYHSFSLSFSLFLCGLLVPSAFNPNDSLSIPSSSLNFGTIPPSVLISLQNSLQGSLHILICLLLLFFLFLSFLRTLSSNSWSYVSLSLPNSHWRCFIPHVPSSNSNSPPCAVSLHFIYAYQSITLFLYSIPLSIYYFYSLITSLTPGTELIIYCVLLYNTQK